MQIEELKTLVIDKSKDKMNWIRINCEPVDTRWMTSMDIHIDGDGTITIKTITEKVMKLGGS